MMTGGTHRRLKFKPQIFPRPTTESLRLSQRSIRARTRQSSPGKNSATGVGLVEIYDLDQSAQSKLANISTRGFVNTGDNVMIGGLIIGGTSGNGAKIVVRAIGPSLTALGVAGALQDPFLEIHDSSGTILASNDNWRDSQSSDIEAAGLTPTDDRESAIVITLPSGAYTTIVRGTNDTVGVGLVEAYNVP